MFFLFVAAAQAEIKRLREELQVLEMENKAKEKENKELVDICDDLLGKLEEERKKNPS